jgi:hypothetical protein
MHLAVKLLIGVLLLIVPLGLYAYEFMYGPQFVIPGTEIGVYLLKSLWICVQGMLPPFLMLIGLFIVWLELDEWRIEKELKAEEKKRKKKKK